MGLRRWGLWLIAAAIWAAPGTAKAQSQIAGTVRDTSGAILPGVTVEASSDVLIEKTKSAVTDGSGQYRIIDLRPGTYIVTFTLTGFQTVRREGVDLPSEFTATIDADDAGRRDRGNDHGHRRRAARRRAERGARAACSIASRSTTSRPAARSRASAR